MRHTARALLAVLLLIGLYVLALATVLGLALGAVVLARSGISGAATAKLALVTLVIALALGRGLLLRRRGPHTPAGLLVSAADQPKLWEEVRTLADEVGTRAPDEIRLVAEVNAAVSEDARLLGLVPGTRRLYVGVPLLQALSPLELRSVLAHELGHYSARHTALAPLTYRGKEAIGRVLTELGPGSLLGRAMGLYGRLYVAVAHGVSRRQELEADEFSARLAGPAAAASALRSLTPLDVAWSRFTDVYAGLGNDQGLRPAPLLEGFATMLEDPEVLARLVEIVDDLPEEARSAYDSHPPLSERIARFEALPAAAPAHPGAPLLVRPAQTLARLEELLLADAELTPAPWAEVVQVSARADARRDRHALGRLAGSEATIASFTDRLSHRGAVGLLTGATAAEEREVLCRLLGQAIADEVVGSGRARFELDWTGPPRVVMTGGSPLDLAGPLRVLAESGDGRPLRDTWGAAGLLGTEPLAVADEDVPRLREPSVLGATGMVQASGWGALLVTPEGVLVVPVTAKERIALTARSVGGAAALARGGELLLERVLSVPPDQHRHGRSRFLAWETIRSGEALVRRVRTSKVVLRLHDGGRQKIRFDHRAVTAGDPWGAIAERLGDRWVVRGAER